MVDKLSRMMIQANHLEKMQGQKNKVRELDYNINKIALVIEAYEETIMTQVS
jgi:cytochrome c peroxidase